MDEHSGEHPRIEADEKAQSDAVDRDRAFWQAGAPYRELIEQVEDYAIFCIDRTGRTTTWNKGVERLLGFSESEFLGVDISSAIFNPEDVRDGVPQWEMEQAVRHGSAGNNRWMQRKDGSGFYCMGITTALRDDDGRLIGFAKVMQDRTLQHRQAQQLQDATRRLAESNRQKDRFLAVLSHELRNPLAPIRNAVDVLRLAAPGSEPARKATDAIDRQSRQLAHLVDDLLDLSRIGRGKIVLQREPVAVERLVRDVGEDHRAAFEQAGIELVVEPNGTPLNVHADRVRLAQILDNLLDNARKFTPKGGRVVLAARPEDGEVVLEVRDSGRGIERESLGNVFELFVQAGTAGVGTDGGGEGGLGIGLPLVKGLVELHGGRLEAQSEGRNRGAAFVIRLPRRGAEEPARPSEPGPEQARAHRTVLIVEDDADAAETLSAALLIRGHETATARSGAEGLERAAAMRPDVVLCDLGLPDIDGVEVARRLRAEAGTAGALLIALSGHALSEDVESAIAAGFDRHVAKPPDLDALDRMISSAPSVDDG